MRYGLITILLEIEKSRNAGKIVNTKIVEIPNSKIIYVSMGNV